ncbi:MAG: alpha/beta hydrolase [Epsilonproteobacteria bacterium]|nr:alpha/beta hydrolase [Campylobacterota bacterium]
MEILLNSKAVSNKYFYPRYSNLENSYYIESGNNKLACYYHKIEHPKKTIIHFHGNGEVVSDYIGSFVEKIEALGCSILLAEYRSYGLSSGDSPSLIDMLDDIENIIKSIDVPLEEIVLFGRSVGSIYALHGAYLFPNISGLVIESGIADVASRIIRFVKKSRTDIIEQMRDEGREYFDHEEKIKSFQGQTLIMHTLYDSLVSVSNAHRLYRWANEPKKLELFLNGDHNSIFHVNKEEYWKVLGEFIDGL